MRNAHASIASFFLFALMVSSCAVTESAQQEQPAQVPTESYLEEDGLLSQFKVLVFSKTTGFRHTSIEAGIAAVQKLGAENNFEVEATEDGAWFTSERLQQYHAVIFMNTNGIDVLDTNQKAAFERYIQQGGGFVGVHSAAATEYEWPWYGELVGAYFDEHPKPQPAEVLVLDRVHPSTAHLPARWDRFDEWYNYRSNPQGKVHVLASLNEQSYEGGKMGYNHPIVWAHEYDGGRAWYTGLGHTEEAYADADFLQHILGGIKWAAGAAYGDAEATLAKNYKKVVLMDQVTDPMEIAIAEDGRVFMVERAGAVKMWDPKTNTTRDIGWIPVYMIIEDGLLGLTLDPDFMENGWLYVFYAPENAGPSRLSRFTVVDDMLDMETEKILLEVPVQRDVCCHAGGSLTFDAAGNLYLSTGDNTDPSDREGSPIDEREGNKYADAQRTSGNTNDLRGKIIRIHPEPDGTYTIPEGNLFEGDDLYRPEIYTMGHRNPFRISVDEKNGWLYWGDVGNGDAPNDRGGWGWDEFNQARGPGFFGWPYFSGKNQPYNDYNYATEGIGQPFNAEAPINDSPNNTGARELPPAQPALIAYTYGASEEFPELGAGGVNPMAGPVYYRKPDYGYKALPAYFEGSHIIYEWMRNWVMEIKFDERGDILKINPFLPGMEFVRPMDMEIGPDGALYVAEWGDTFWGSNANAQVVRIEYDKDNIPLYSTLPAPDKSMAVHIDAPRPGGFFEFDEPVAYKVHVYDEMGRRFENHDLTVNTYSGFDTHKILLNQQSDYSGETVITKAYTHTPDIHMMDRFAIIEACVTSEKGTRYCDEVKLHPHQREAEHVSWQKNASRQTHGSHPASASYPATALTTMQVRNGSVLAYEPVDLSEITSVTLRFKKHAAGNIMLHANSEDGPMLGKVHLDNAHMVMIEETNHMDKTIDLSVEHDAALADVNTEIYEDWSEVTVPLSYHGEIHALVITFEGEPDTMLLELDWVLFR